MFKQNQVNGHELRQRPDDGKAFLPDTVSDGDHKLLPTDAEEMAEEFMVSATGAESIHSDANDEVVDDEEGGPFIILDDKAQFPDSERLGASSDGHEPEQIKRGARWAARG